MKNEIKSAKRTPTPLYIRTPVPEILDPHLIIIVIEFPQVELKVYTCALSYGIVTIQKLFVCLF